MKHVSCGKDVKDNFKKLYGSVKLEQLERYDKLLRGFKGLGAGSECCICSSSGRVEIIGNHTDHNGGKVMGAAVSLDILAAFAPADDNFVVVRSEGHSDIKFKLDEIDVKEPTSKGMIKGVLKGFADRNLKIGGLRAYVTSTVPSGSGLSSSAAYEMLFAQIFNNLYNSGAVDSVTLAEIAQYSEREYFNKPCGLLDQGVVALGNIVEIDFKNGFCYRQIDSDLFDFDLVVVNAGGSHADLTEHYAAIPREMKDVAEYFGKTRLADVDEAEFESEMHNVQEKVGLRAALRAKHFFEENKRVDYAYNCLKAGDKTGFLRAISQSGESSIKYLQNCRYDGGDDKLYNAVKLCESMLEGKGATRLHGGGFAGTVLNVVEKSYTAEFTTKARQSFGENNVYLLKIRSCGTTVL
ncbi:MAG: hypothetical protein NC350_00810 [Corallococcus sp.]|nr:hypothetical protein [Corallococcus sp.]